MIKHTLPNRTESLHADRICKRKYWFAICIGPRHSVFTFPSIVELARLFIISVRTQTVGASLI